MKKNQDLYTKMFSKVKSNMKIDVEEILMKDSRKKSNILKKGFIMSAAIMMIFGLSITAYATDFLGLKSYIIGIDYSQGEEPQDNPMTMISMQGWQGSEERKALVEWQHFLSSYDSDGAILATVGNRMDPQFEKYILYNVYSQEMADKLEEISAKYNLSLHSKRDFIMNKEQLIELSGENVLGEKNDTMYGYVYEDGTYLVEVNNRLTEDLNISFQLMKARKGSLTDVTLNIGNLSEFEEWNYTTSTGVEVLLGLSPSKGLIILEGESFYVTVNVLSGTYDDYINGGNNIVKEELEQLAESLNLHEVK